MVKKRQKLTKASQSLIGRLEDSQLNGLTLNFLTKLSQVLPS
jgi:hypothetical protein